MRIRFFWIIFSVLTIVSVGAVLFHNLILRQDSLMLIDQQVRDTATAFLNSDLNSSTNINIERIDGMLSSELGAARIGKFFILRDENGKVIFSSTTARLLALENMPQEPQWITAIVDRKYVRILNLKLSNIPHRSVQVGAVVDNSLLSPTYMSWGNFWFVTLIFLSGLATAWLLTSSLLRPISRLVEFITGLSDENSLAALSLPPGLAKFKTKSSKNDELLQLIDSFLALLEKQNRNQKLSRVWSYQMAHELKTPMAIMSEEIASAVRNNKIDGQVAESLRAELTESAGIVTEFLTWAELEGTSSHSNLFALSARKTVDEIRQRLSSHFGQRIELSIRQDFYVLANAQHFEHLLVNLIKNALIYSPSSRPIRVEVADRAITVIDHGAGIPSQVIDRLGEPFNKASQPLDANAPKGHGLGLAYVQSVCKLYGWKLEIASTDEGTAIKVDLSSRKTDNAGQELQGNL